MTDEIAADQIAVADIAGAGLPAPPEMPGERDQDEALGLEEIDPLGLGQMASDLEELDETPEAGPVTYADVKARKRARSAKVPLVLDVTKRFDLVNARAELEEAKTALSAAPDRADRRGRVDAALDAVAAAEEALGAVTVVWELQSIGRARLRSLIAACPPTPEQRSRHKADRSGLGIAGGNGPLYDPDRFQPTLVAACVVSPVLTIDDAVDMWSDPGWTEGELDTLFLTAWQLNQVAV